MARQQPSRFVASLHDLKQAGRSTGGAENLCELHRREGCQLRGLEDHGVAARQRRSRFPASNLQRVIPGANPRDYTQRLAPCVTERLRPQINVLASEACGKRGEVLQAIGTR